MSGTIKREANGTYKFTVDLGRKPDGRRNQILRRGFKTKKAADEAMTALKEAHHKGELLVSSAQLLKDYLEDWLRLRESLNGDKERNLEDKARIVRVNLAPSLGHIRLKDLTAAHIEDAYLQMLCERRDGRSGGLSAKTIKNIHAVLSQALSKAVSRKLLRESPASHVDLPQAEDTEVNVINRDQCATLLAFAQDRVIYPIAYIALATGMRRGELSALRWSNVDLDRGVVRVTETVSETKGSKLTIKPPKTKAGVRDITLPPSVAEYLRQHRAHEAQKFLRLGERPEDGFVFTTQVGAMRTPNSITNEWDKLRKLVAKNAPDFPHVRFHDLRHTHISQLLADRKPLTWVSKRAGHKNTHVTATVYAHWIKDDDDVGLLMDFDAGLSAAIERQKNKAQNPM